MAGIPINANPGQAVPQHSVLLSRGNGGQSRVHEETSGGSTVLKRSDGLSISSTARRGVVDKCDSPLPLGTIELNVLTQNVWALRSMLGLEDLLGICKDRMPRLERLAKAVRGYDIVGLQETFSDDSNVILRDSGYPARYRQDRGGRLTINSGLTTLARYRFEKVEFRKFTKASPLGWEALGRKGIMLTRLQVPGFGNVDVYNTHLQADDDVFAKAVRRDQIRELANFIRENDKGNPTVLVGDFNLEEGSEEHKFLMEQLNPLDTYRRANQNEAGYTCSSRNPYNGRNAKNQRLDYIFVLPNPRYEADVLGSRIVHDQPVEGYMLSDHYGLVTRLRIRRKS